MARISMLGAVLVSALLISSVSATAYLETSMTYWDGLVANIANPAHHIRYVLYMIWYSLAPIVAPVIYQYTVNFFEGTGTFTVDSYELPLGEALPLIGMPSQKAAFQTLMSFVPKVLCNFMNGAGIPCDVTFNDTETFLATTFGLSV